MDNELKECEECGNLIPENSPIFEAEGWVYCEDCFYENFVYCVDCDAIVSIENCFCKDDNCYCEYCYDQNFTFCYGCKEIFLLDEVTVVDTDAYCENCFSENFVYCTDCNVILSMEHCFCRGHNCYCESCYSEACYSAHLHSVEYRPSSYNYLRTSTDKAACLYMGCEVEVEQVTGDIDDNLDCIINQYDPDEEKFYIKADRSLKAGFELVSMPCSLKYHKKEFNWGDILKSLMDNGCRSHDTHTCGLHIHASKRCVTLTEQIRIGIFIHTQEQRMEIFARRGGNSYTAFKDIKTNGYTYANKNEDRYEAVNFLPRHTIEFRLFRGTLKLETFYASLEFVHAVLNFVKTISSQKLIDIDYAWNKFCEYVKTDKKEYKNLITYMNNKNLMV